MHATRSIPRALGLGECRSPSPISIDNSLVLRYHIRGVVRSKVALGIFGSRLEPSWDPSGGTGGGRRWPCAPERTGWWTGSRSSTESTTGWTSSWRTGRQRLRKPRCGPTGWTFRSPSTSLRYVKLSMSSFRTLQVAVVGQLGRLRCDHRRQGRSSAPATMNDEEGFRALRANDVGVKAGEGDTAAGCRGSGDGDRNVP
jgi:hypothetical protein